MTEKPKDKNFYLGRKNAKKGKRQMKKEKINRYELEQDVDEILECAENLVNKYPQIENQLRIRMYDFKDGVLFDAKKNGTN